MILDRHTVEQRRNGRQVGRFVVRNCFLRTRLVARRRNVRQRLRPQEHDVVTDNEMDFLALRQTCDLRSGKIEQHCLVADLLDDHVMNERSACFGHDFRDSPQRSGADLSPVAIPQLHFDAAHLPRIVFDLFSPAENRLVRKPVSRAPRPDLAQTREHVPPRRKSARQTCSALPPVPQGKQLAQRFHVRHGEVQASSERPVRPALPLSAPAFIGLEKVLVGVELDLLIAEKLQPAHTRRQRLEVDQRAGNLQHERTLRRDAGGVVEQRETVALLFQNVREPLEDRTETLALPSARHPRRARHETPRSWRIPPLKGRQGQERIFGHGTAQLVSG